MRAALAAVVVVACAALAAGADDEKYTSRDGKVAVAFPANSKVKTETKEDGSGVKMYVAAVEDKNRAYAVMYFDAPDAAKNVPAKDLLDGAVKGAVRESKGKLVESKDITFGKKKY